MHFTPEGKALALALADLDIPVRGKPANVSQVVEEAIRALAKAKGVRA